MQHYREVPGRMKGIETAAPFSKPVSGLGLDFGCRQRVERVLSYFKNPENCFLHSIPIWPKCEKSTLGCTYTSNKQDLYPYLLFLPECKHWANASLSTGLLQGQRLTRMSSSLYSRRLPSGSSNPAHSSSPPTSPP